MKENGTMNWLEQIHQMKNRDIRTIEQSELLELPQDDVIWEQERKVITAEERMHKGQANVANIRAMLAKAKEKG